MTPRKRREGAPCSGMAQAEPTRIIHVHPSRVLPSPLAVSRAREGHHRGLG